MATPAHVAIIMDGNGRWAKARGLPRLAGHRAGVEALRNTVRAAPELGISYLTVYAFSSENWSRPKSEVSDLMGLLKIFIRRDLAELHQNGVRVRIIGDRQGLQPDIKALLEEAGISAPPATLEELIEQAKKTTFTSKAGTPVTGMVLASDLAVFPVMFARAYGGDFISPDGAPGYFEQELLVYGRDGLPCPNCGRALKHATIGQRASVWCAHCQR